MHTRINVLMLAILGATMISSVASAFPSGIKIAGECELTSPNNNETFPFEVVSATQGFNSESVNIPFILDDQELTLRLTHYSQITWHFAGREIPESRSFAASVYDIDENFIVGKSMQLPYRHFNGRDVAAILIFNEESKIVCSGTAVGSRY